MADQKQQSWLMQTFQNVFSAAFPQSDVEGVGIGMGEMGYDLTSTGGPISFDGDIGSPDLSRSDLPAREITNIDGGYDALSRRQRYASYEQLEELVPEIHSSLNTYADEACSYDDENHVLKIRCSSEAVKEELEFLFFNSRTIDVDSRVWGMTRNVCKYGDGFWELVIDPKSPQFGVLKLNELDPHTMWRIQSRKGTLLEFQQTMMSPDYDIVIKDIKEKHNKDKKPYQSLYWRGRANSNKNLIRFAPAQVVHVVIGSEERGFKPYGISVLQPARRPAYNLRLMEDSMLLYRLSRGTERRVYYVDVGQMSGTKVDTYVEQFKNRTKRKRIYNDKTQQVDERFNPWPIRRTTPVPLLDGRTITIEEIAREYEAGKTNWVFSVLDDTTGKIVPGKIVWCGKNYHCSNMIRVWCDDGGYVDVAPEHPFVLRNGSSKRADELNVGDSLMPLHELVSEGEVPDTIQRIVSKIDKLDESDDVYCMTVVGPNGEHDRHNFAVKNSGISEDSFIFVKNSVDDDLYIPIRPNTNTRVDVLPGACLDLDTKIPLLDGRTLKLFEIIEEHDNGHEHWVYSCDPRTGRIVPGKVTWAGVTRQNAEVMCLTLDNGETITCTPDHKFPVLGIGPVEAKDLAPGMSLIPFRTRMRHLGTKHKRSYTQVYDTHLKKWVFVHRMVAEYLKETNLRIDMVYDESFHDAHRGIIHHINLDRYDNNPKNLAWMNREDHFRIHSEKAREWWASLSVEQKDEQCRKLRNGILEFFINGDEDKVYAFTERIRAVQPKGVAISHELLATDPEFRAMFKARQKEGWASALKADPEKFRHRGQRIAKANAERYANAEYKKRVFEKQTIVFPQVLVNFVMTKLGEGMLADDIIACANADRTLIDAFIEANADLKRKNLNLEAGLTTDRLKKLVKQAGYHGIKQARNEVHLYNHKVVSIEVLREKIDTGTLTIDGNEELHDYHTFAIDSGVFTYNSNLSDIDDALYFRKKLYVALKIPPGYLEQTVEAATNRLSLTSLDMRFAKVIFRIQKAIANAFREVAIRHLTLLGVPREEFEDLEIIMTPSSEWREMAQAEVMQNRINLASSIKSMDVSLSDDWILERIFKLPDEEIDREKGRKRRQEIERAELEGTKLLIAARYQAEIDRGNMVNQATIQQFAQQQAGAQGMGPDGQPLPQDQDGQQQAPIPTEDDLFAVAGEPNEEEPGVAASMTPKGGLGTSTERVPPRARITKADVEADREG